MQTGLTVGVRLKEVATKDVVYRDCVVLHSDGIGLMFEVQRTVADAGGDVDLHVSQLLIPWVNIKHVVLMEERT